MTRFARRALLAFLPFVAPPALAGGGDDHTHAEEQVAPAAAAPRVVATSDLFELVGILGPDGRVTIYLDRTESNAPVDGARLVATLDGVEIVADRIAEGTYRLDHPPLARPGRHDIAFTITVGEEADLLAGTLEVPEAAAATAAPHDWRDHLRDAPVLWAGGALLLLLGMLLGRLLAPRALPPMVEEEEEEEAAAGATPPVAAPLPPPAADAAADAEAARRRRRAGAPVAAVLAALAAGPALAQIPIAEPPRRMPDGAVFIPKPTQRLLGIRTQVTEMASAAVALHLVGTVVPDPNASGHVQPSQTGRLEPGEAGLPVLGQRVERGQVLAHVVPTYSASERGALQQSVAQLDAQIAIVSARVTRLAALRGSVSEREIMEAQAELEGLRQRRAAIEPALSGREELRAPVAGVISVARAAVGQIVDSRQTVFEIVDPARLWVEALAFDTGSRGAAQGPIAGADLLLGDGRTAPLEFVGRGLSARQQAVPMNFRLPDPPEGLTVGAPVTVVLRVPRRAEGIVLPAEAVVRGTEGPAVVYEHTTPERFVARQVRAEPLDGARVLVTGGLEPGLRVVTQAAGLIAQVR
jgi:membrane fusion protein, heavy metal efflux system